MVNNGDESGNWEEIGRRNIDLGERLTEQGLTTTYDEDGDTLFVTIGQGGDALTEQVFDDIYIRIHPETLKIQGFVILAFEPDFLGENKLIGKSLQGFVEAMRASEGTLSFKGRDAQKAKPYFEAAIANR